MAHGHKEPVVISSLYYGSNELAGLITLLKAQDKWPKPMVWREESECLRGGGDHVEVKVVGQGGRK